MFSICLISAESNDITNIPVKSILVQKIAYTSIYDIIMSMAPDKAVYCVFTQFLERVNAIKFISVRTKTQ